MTDEQQQLAMRFEEHRTYLQTVAYRMLGSTSEAEDAVQEAWLRLDRADTQEVRNLRGWLITVVGRVCLDMLRARKARREDLTGEALPGLCAESPNAADPEEAALLADSVGLALLVVLERLSPDERLAFVLHDMFDLPFDTIAPIVGRSPNTAAQLAARARRRVRGKTLDSHPDLARQRQVVEAFLAAGRNGDIDALVAVLDTDVVLHVDRTAAGTDSPLTVRGRRTMAAGASYFSEYARQARPALIDGAVGLIVAPRGRLSIVLTFTIGGDKIIDLHICADPERLRQLDIRVLDAVPMNRW